MERIEEQTTLVQGALLLVGAALFLSEGFGLSQVAGFDPTTLGIGVYGLALGSFAVGNRIQGGLQGTAALGFGVLFVATVASMGLAATILGAVLVVLAIVGQVYLQTHRRPTTEEPPSGSDTDV